MHDRTRRGVLGLGAGALLGLGGAALARPIPAQATGSILEHPALAPVSGSSGFGRNIKAFGAVGDGVADDTAAIAAASAQGGIVYCPTPAAFYRTTAPIILAPDTVFVGDGGLSGSRGAKIRNAVSDVFQARGQLYGVSFEGLFIEASAGHIFNLGTDGAASFTIRNCALNQLADNKSVLKSASLNDSLFMQLNITHTPTATVPTFDLVSAANDINTNTWFRMRFTYTGTYAIHVENTNSNGYCNDNTFRDINFEVANGGMIRLLSTHGTMIENVQLYDPGTTRRDLVVVGKSPSGPPPRYTTIRHMKRLGGRLGSGLKDIRLQGNAGFTVIETCDTAGGGGFTIDLGGNDARIDNCPKVTLENAGPGTFATRSNGAVPADVYLRQSAANSGIVIEGPTGKRYQELIAGNDFVISEDAVTPHTALRAGGNLDIVRGDVVVAAVGKGLRVKEGGNAKLGTATLVNGEVTVDNTSVTNNSRIFLTVQSPGEAVGPVYISARISGRSFTITSESDQDTSTVAWMLVEPG